MKAPRSLTCTPRLDMRCERSSERTDTLMRSGVHMPAFRNPQISASPICRRSFKHRTGTLCSVKELWCSRGNTMLALLLHVING